MQPVDLQPLSFRVKKFDYSRYYIDSLDVRGILNLAEIVANVGRMPDDQISPDQMPLDELPIVMSPKSVVSFTNQGGMHAPTS